MHLSAYGCCLDEAAKYSFISTWLILTFKPGKDGAIVLGEVTCTVLWQAKQLFSALCDWVKVSTVVFDSCVEPVRIGVFDSARHSRLPGWNVQFGFRPLLAINHSSELR
jgi:hypothetical protein